MLEARIVSTKGSLYFSSESTPYDLQTLRAHVLDAAHVTPNVRLEMRIDDGDWQGLRTSGWLRSLTDAGIPVTRGR